MKSKAIKIVTVESWCPHPKAAPKTKRTGQKLFIAANGTRFSCGGWQIKITGLVPTKTYRIKLPYRVSGLLSSSKKLSCLAIWGNIPPDKVEIDDEADNDFLLIQPASPTAGLFYRDVTVPAGVKILTVRVTLRWTASGSAALGLPVISKVKAISQSRVKIAVATGSIQRRKLAKISTVAGNLSYYTQLCKEAVRLKPDFIVLPEIALQWRVLGHPVDTAIRVNGPEVSVFRRIAKANQLHILLPIFEREGDAVFNTALLIGPKKIEGRYRKVHLAEYGETNSGIMPGNSFPVFKTPAGRVGCLICMDSSCQEASRMLGLNGAEIMFLPIMGDIRADRFTRGEPVFHEERWKVIMRSRTLDNHFLIAVARNESIGSCIIDRKGEIRSWNDGTKDVICAEIELNPNGRTWNGVSQRDVNWLQRRPELYTGSTVAIPPVVNNL